jgi:hypothetical protein
VLKAVKAKSILAKRVSAKVLRLAVVECETKYAAGLEQVV